jgi:hypothetical protein
MKRSGNAKFPNSVQLFKFCQKVLSHQKGTKVRDQEVGVILDFNPSDCSHWKRGEKNVKSVFALAKLSEALQVEANLIYDVASGNANLEEAFFEYNESRAFGGAIEKAQTAESPIMTEKRHRIDQFVTAIHEQSEFRTAPLYLPEVLRNFAFIGTQPIEMLDRLSRILRVKPGQYTIHYRKGDMRPQTRMSVTKDLSRILFEAERSRFPELGNLNSSLVEFEELYFTANLLAPKALLIQEMNKLDLRRNVVAELSTMFWVPKSLISFQLQEIVRSGMSSNNTTQDQLISKAS